MTTSANFRFRPSRVKGKTGMVYVRLIHDRVVRQITTGYKLFPAEWDGDRVVMPGRDAERYRYLDRARQGMREMKWHIERAISRLEATGRPYTSDEVVKAYRLANGDESRLATFSCQLAERLRRVGKHRLSETYLSAVSSFLRFRGEKGDVRLDAMDHDLMRDYERYLLDERGLCRNTASFYQRNLRAVYNQAVRQGLTPDRHPFAGVYTGVAKTLKRAVTIETIRRIKDLDLAWDADLAFARDLYLLSFYLRGISFVDLALLETRQLRDGYLRYVRQKTGRQLEIKWEEQMRRVVDRYHVPGSRYLLPILPEWGGNVRRQYLNALHWVNTRLRRIGRMVGCPIPLTTYTARHGWASAARDLHVATPSISQALGHDSERTTRIYLSSLECKVIDDANQVVIHALHV